MHILYIIYMYYFSAFRYKGKIVTSHLKLLIEEAKFDKEIELKEKSEDSIVKQKQVEFETQRKIIKWRIIA